MPWIFQNATKQEREAFFKKYKNVDQLREKIDTMWDSKQDDTTIYIEATCSKFTINSESLAKCPILAVEKKIPKSVCSSETIVGMLVMWLRFRIPMRITNHDERAATLRLLKYAGFRFGG